jgi:hypothetical protein
MIFLIHTRKRLSEHCDIQISHSMKFCTLDTYFKSFFTEQTQTQYMKHKRSKLCSYDFLIVQIPHLISTQILKLSKWIHLECINDGYHPVVKYIC